MYWNILITRNWNLLPVHILVTAAQPNNEEVLTDTSVWTHVVMESFGLTRVLTCVSSLGSCTVQVPENTATHRERNRSNTGRWSSLPIRQRLLSFFLPFSLFFLISIGIDASNWVRTQQPEEELFNMIKEIRLSGKKKSLEAVIREWREEALREL